MSVSKIDMQRCEIKKVVHKKSLPQTVPPPQYEGLDWASLYAAVSVENSNKQKANQNSVYKSSVSRENVSVLVYQRVYGFAA